MLSIETQISWLCQLGWKKKDILSRFLQLTETNPRYLRDVTLNFMAAGKDTTAISLSWFIYMLCKNPSIQEKVAHEIKEVTKVDKITDIEEFAVNMPEEVLQKMQYLHAALTETLRLCPVLPVVTNTISLTEKAFILAHKLAPLHFNSSYFSELKLWQVSVRK